MKILLSPAKTFAKEVPAGLKMTEPLFTKETKDLIKALQGWHPNDFQKIMGVSENIAHLNHQRYQLWNEQGKHPALAYFKGDVYRGIAVEDFSDEDWQYAQKTVNILSGLYGCLRARDAIKNYRLEMGTRWAPTGKDLYEFWSDKITKELNEVESEVIINLASNEYWKAVDQRTLKAPVITPVFKDNDKVVAIYAKRARGLMARYAVKNKVTDPADLKKFDLEGYRFEPNLSHQSDWIFVR